MDQQGSHCEDTALSNQTVHRWYPRRNFMNGIVAENALIVGAGQYSQRPILYRRVIEMDP